MDNPTLPTLPAIFFGHGSPMNAIEDNEFSRAWSELGRAIPRPQAILCISAHWQSRGTQVTAIEKPKTIYDFYGFPPELYRQVYPAPGSTDLARQVQGLLAPTPVGLDQKWGLDHGTWSVLSHVYPKADIPVVQLSLDAAQPEAYHYELAKKLRPLRQQGVLVVGSGNIVHNLRLINWEDKPFDWALETDALAKELIETRNYAGMIAFPGSSRAAQLAVPTNEHFLPLLYILALQGENDSLRFFTEKISFGSLSMRGVVIG
jgi:4,5-DOPA dioxygenase extradiol